MTAVWIAILAVAAATIALKGAGPVAFTGRPLPRVISLVMPLLAPCLLAALVVGQTVADGRAVVIDARLAGVAAAAVALVLLGLSSSGGAVGYQFEPGFYGAVSQLLPPGAAVTAVRNVQYFDWSATLAPLVVLGAWAAGGLGLGLLGERLGRRADALAPAPVGVPSPGAAA